MQGLGSPRDPLPHAVFSSRSARAIRNGLYAHFLESAARRPARATFTLWRGVAALALPFLIAGMFYLSCSLAGCIGIFIPFAALPFLQVLRRRRAYMEPVSQEARFPLRVSDAFSDHETRALFATDLWLTPIDRREVLEAIAFEALEENSISNGVIKVLGVVACMAACTVVFISGQLFTAPSSPETLGQLLIAACAGVLIAETTGLLAAWNTMRACKDALQIRIDFWWGAPVVLPMVMRYLGRVVLAILLPAIFAVTVWFCGLLTGMLFDLLGYLSAPFKEFFEGTDVPGYVGASAGIALWINAVHRERRTREADLPATVEHLCVIGAIALEHHLRTTVFGDAKSTESG